MRKTAALGIVKLTKFKIAVPVCFIIHLCMQVVHDENFLYFFSILKADKSELDESKVSDDTLDDGPASSDLICQWAKKLFSQQFPTISHLARYLISNNYVSCNSLNAFTVVAADDTGQSSSPPESIENKNQAESALIKGELI